MGQVAVQPPVILEEEAHGDIGGGTVGTSNSLNVRARNSEAVSLQAGRVGNNSTEGDPAKVDVAAKDQLEDLLFFGTKLNEDSIASHFESVLAATEGDIVRDFKYAD